MADCIELEHVDTHCDYEEHKDSFDEIRFLYDWWKQRSSDDYVELTEKTDDEMLDRLMKVRTFLWS